jgi:RNA polymerase sigma factor (TIGR02999 family)
MPTDEKPITEFLFEIKHGNQAALGELLPIVYDELPRLAKAHLSRERAGHTLNTTSLVHESYLRLAGIQAVDWSDRSRFLGMASRAMRRVLIDYARARMRQKRSAAPDDLERLLAIRHAFAA